MEILQKVVRCLSSWAWKHERGVTEGVAYLQSLEVDEKGFTTRLEITPEVAQHVARSFASIVASSPNYTELKFELKHPDNRFEWITVLVQKGQGLTPHQLREQAENELRKLKAKYGN
jgi:hypothetical protein